MHGGSSRNCWKLLSFRSPDAGATRSLEALLQSQGPRCSPRLSRCQVVSDTVSFVSVATTWPPGRLHNLHRAKSPSNLLERIGSVSYHHQQSCAQIVQATNLRSVSKAASTLLSDMGRRCRATAKCKDGSCTASAAA